MSALQLVPLVLVKSYSLREILREERASWMRDLNWDYSEPQRIIDEMIDRSELPGHVAVIEDQPAGYSFYLCQDDLGLFGNCFVTARLSGLNLEERLLRANIESMWRNRGISRIEAQLVDLRELQPVRFFERLGFRSFERCFLQRDCKPIGFSPPSAELTIERWSDTATEAAARLTARAYEGLTDREMARHYQSPEGCLEFLCGMILRPGCGVFLKEASFCIWTAGSRRLAGYILTSLISPKNGHIPQVTIAPDFQGRGLGTLLIGQALQSLSDMGCQQVSLSVTRANHKALSLYQHLGFQTLFTFPSFVWDKSFKQESRH
jgi:ribosomal protein S18 acetylase RimI-like enzyme